MSESSKSFWSDVTTCVAGERPLYGKHFKGLLPSFNEMIPTSYAIGQVSWYLGLQWEEVLDLVQEFAICNHHPTLLPLIKTGNFSSLAKRLWRDRTIIPLISPEQNGGDLLEHLVDAVADVWYEDPEEDPTNWEMWNLTLALSDKYNELQGQSPDEMMI
jgi:hypothetical protein